MSNQATTVDKNAIQSNMEQKPTLIPQRKGEMLVPYTGSWLMAMISVFLRMPSISELMVAS